MTNDEVLAEQLATGIRLWTLIDPVEVPTKGPFGATAVIGTDSHGPVVLLFTDHTLALEFASKSIPGKFAAVNFRDASHVRHTLEFFEKRGVRYAGDNYVPLDDHGNAKGTLIPIRQAIDTYGRGPDRGQDAG